MEKFYTLLFNVVSVDCNALVPAFWKLLNSSFKDGFQWLLYPTLHTCNDLTVILESRVLKAPSLVQTNNNQIELSLDCTLDDPVQSTSVSIELTLLKQQCEDERCFGGSKLNPAPFFAFSILLATAFHSGELNNNAH
jgi:hypothetical protein